MGKLGALALYLFLYQFRVFDIPFTWWGVVLLFVAETATGTVLRHFEDELAKVVAQAAGVELFEVEYADRDGNPRSSLEVSATEIQFLSRAESRSDQAESRAKAASATSNDGRKVSREESRAAMLAQGPTDMTEDEIPF